MQNRRDLRAWKQVFPVETEPLRTNRCRAQIVIFYPATFGTSLTAAQESLFQSFQWFDGLTMSGFILNRFAQFTMGISPFKSFKPFNRYAPLKPFLANHIRKDFRCSQLLVSSCPGPQPVCTVLSERN